MLKKSGVFLLLLLFLLSLSACEQEVPVIPTDAISTDSVPTDPTDPTQPPELPEEPDTTPSAADALVGDWIGWSGATFQAGEGKVYRCVHISFLEDGTFTDYEMAHLIMEDGTDTEMVTRHTYGGTYTVEDDVLILNYTYFNSGNPDDAGKTATTTHKIALEDSVMQIEGFGYSDNQYPKLYKGLSVPQVVAAGQ